MKLRNKKTGEIVTFDSDHNNSLADFGGELLLETRTGKEYSYDSLAGLNADWEDYKPAEPLIKDEKIRKAVRAWAEAIGATKNIVFDGSKKIYSFYYENNKGGFEKLLIYGDNDLEELKRYTTAELCGEEE